MRRPKIGCQVAVDLPPEDCVLTEVVVEGPWILTGEVQGKPNWKVDRGNGFPTGVLNVASRLMDWVSVFVIGSVAGIGNFIGIFRL